MLQWPGASTESLPVAPHNKLRVVKNRPDGSNGCLSLPCFSHTGLCYFFNMPGELLPQGLCTFCSGTYDASPFPGQGGEGADILLVHVFTLFLIFAYVFPPWRALPTTLF